jgi:hypothetical protein
MVESRRAIQSILRKFHVILRITVGWGDGVGGELFVEMKRRGIELPMDADEERGGIE